jgi:hypothetical protein
VHCCELCAKTPGVSVLEIEMQFAFCYLRLRPLVESEMEDSLTLLPRAPNKQQGASPETSRVIESQHSLDTNDVAHCGDVEGNALPYGYLSRRGTAGIRPNSSSCTPENCPVLIKTQLEGRAPCQARLWPPDLGELECNHHLTGLTRPPQDTRPPTAKPNG